MHNSKRQFLVYSLKVFDIAIMLMAMTCGFILAEMPRNGIVWPHDLWQMNLQLINVLLLLFLRGDSGESPGK
jgi:hypothetical protein